jgi:mannose-6-phosphate isomerase-like protein (cupin superfamily)
MSISPEDLKEKPYLLVSSKNALLRKSSQGCDEKFFIHSDKISCGTFVIPPGKRLGRISAHGADEIYFVLRGTLKVNLPRLEETIEVKTGEVFYMPAGMIHAPYNDGKEETEIFWSCAPEWP